MSASPKAWWISDTAFLTDEVRVAVPNDVVFVIVSEDGAGGCGGTGFRLDRGQYGEGCANARYPLFLAEVEDGGL